MWESEEPPSTVVVSFEGPRGQHRGKVAFRWILAIPQYFVVVALGVAAFFVMIAAWFAALFTGRVPAGMAGFLGRVLQYSERVNAYALYLMTDRYPPFSLSAPDYAVSVHFAPDRLNRAAVLFRFVLTAPLWFMLQLIDVGVLLISFVVWLIVLIRGVMPASVFEAYAAIIRFEARCYGYVAMLSTAYPRGLFGDATPAPAVPASSWEQALAPNVPPPPSGPPPPPPPTSIAPMPAPTAPPLPGRITRIVVSRSAKRIIVAVLVLGVVFQVGTNIASAVLSTRLSGLESEVRDARAELVLAEARLRFDVQRCNVDDIECVNTAYGDVASAYERFSFELSRLRYPAGSVDRASRVIIGSGQVGSSYRGLVAVSDPVALAQRLEAVAALRSELDDDYDDLIDSIS